MKNKRKIFEAPIDEPTGFRINPDLKGAIERGETPLSNSPFIPKKGEDDRQSFEEIAASKRFRDVVTKLERYLGMNVPNNMGGLQMMMMRLFGEVTQFESSRRQQLEQLAKDLVSNELVDPKYAEFIQFDPKLVGMGDAGNENFQAEPEEFSSEDIELAFEDSGEDLEEFVDAFENFDYMVAKRWFMNAIIQGAAKKGHYIFQKPDVKARLDAIDPSLYRDYLGIMAINDFMYFTMEQMIEMMSQTGQGVAGKVSLEDADDDGEEGGEGGGEEQPDTKIVATGMIFPILCHEIIKGLEEAKGRHGHSKNPDVREKVRGAVDVLSNEPMQLRIGPEIVEKIRFALPDEMFDESNKGLINWFHILLYQVPAQEFLEIVGNAISEDQSKISRATSRFEEIMKEAMQMKEEFENYKEENDTESDSDDDDEDDLDDFLGSLGISRPK
jgi:NACalpha-BTF3-like transcription factor